MAMGEKLSDEGRTPRALKDPGLLTKEKVDNHNTTHISCRSYVLRAWLGAPGKGLTAGMRARERLLSRRWYSTPRSWEQRESARRWQFWPSGIGGRTWCLQVTFPERGLHTTMLRTSCSKLSVSLGAMR